MKSNENLKNIRFEGELLPKWAQLLDLASTLCPVPDKTRSWFSKFSNSSGVDDARTVLAHCGVLRGGIQEHQQILMTELRRLPDDDQASQIYGAWIYALDTMIQQASAKKTCAWIVEGLDNTDEDDSGEGDISLRRA